MTPARILLVVLATLRATRFITSDALGEWWIVGPAKRWAWEHEGPVTSFPASDAAVPTPSAAYGWRSKLVKGLDCPFCVGFWLGALVLAGEALFRFTPLRVVRPVWTFLLATAGLNYVVGHVSSRIDT